MNTQATYNMAPVAPILEGHRYFQYVSNSPDTETVRELAQQLANYYFNRDWSRRRWAKEPPLVCRWESSVRKSDNTVVVTQHSSPPLHYDDFVKHLTETSSFNFAQLGVPDPLCRWLDSSVMFSPGFCAPSNDGSHSLTFQAEPTLGSRFPLIPTLDREGVAYTSFQMVLLKRIRDLRTALIAASGSPEKAEWFQSFRSLVSECVALIENTVHQVYFKAKYDPLPGWKFVPTRLGERHRRNTMEKLDWVHEITRNPLHAEAGKDAYKEIKDLRNHLNHFDPPSFACTWEEVAGWLNAVVHVAQLAWKIRRCLSATPAVPLIELLLERPIEFRPKDPGRARLPQAPYAGYASTSPDTLKSEMRPAIPHETVPMPQTEEIRLLPPLVGPNREK